MTPTQHTRRAHGTHGVGSCAAQARTHVARGPQDFRVRGFGGRPLTARGGSFRAGAAAPGRLLETPTDRFAKVERAHAARLRDEQQRRLGVAEREAVRERKVDAWRERVHSASLRLQASRETRGTRG
jgi:hypothetical protein